MSQPIVFIQGGGAGLDQEKAVRRILQAAGVETNWQTFYAGRAALEQGMPAFPKEMLQACREAGTVLKTKLLAPLQGEMSNFNFNVELRKQLGLFAAVRPLHNLPSLPARFHNINILVVREITEDLYNASEHEIVPGVVQSIKVVTANACKRFFRFTFELARQEGRKSVHCIHKANILKLADGLFLESFREVAKDFPDIQPKEMIVDNCCMQMVTKPQQFDILACGNMYGDLISDLGAGLIGGITTASGINYGENLRVYECIHGAGYEMVPPDRANPLSLLFTALEMLWDQGRQRETERLQAAVERVLLAGQVRTGDLGGNATTTQMTEALLRELEK
jgi:isocitrate dehydrogenase (NAD+)